MDRNKEVKQTQSIIDLLDEMIRNAGGIRYTQKFDPEDFKNIKINGR